MAKAPTPGATSQPEPSIVKFRLTDGTEVTCDIRGLTMTERRLARNELKRLDDADELEALVAALWVVMRRDDDTVDFLELMDRVTVGVLQDGDIVDDSPSEDDPSR